MRTVCGTRLELTVLLGSLTLALCAFGCKPQSPNRTSGSGGQGSGGSSNSGGSSGSGGNRGSGGDQGSGGSEAMGGSGGGGNEGGESGSSGSGGNGEGGSSQNGGSSGAGGAGQSGGNSGAGGANDSGGTTGSGGATNSGGSNGSGGSTGTTGSGCSAPVAPANGSAGGVTNFSDYSTSSGKWGSTSNVYGSIYGYPGTNGSTLTAKVDSTAGNLHFTGSVVSGDYAGGGVSFENCATVAAFTKVSFAISGSLSGTGASSCALELQIQTFEQRPTTATPPGSCDASAGSCYGFPSYAKIAVPSSTSTVVTTSLADFSGWKDELAKQVMGLQWQVTMAPASGTDSTTCEVDFSVDDIKFE